MHTQFKGHKVSPKSKISVSHLVVTFGLEFVFSLSFRLGLGLPFMSPWGEELLVEGHLNDLYCPYFLPDVMMKFTRKAKGHFVTIIEVGMDLTRHDSIRSQEFSVNAAYHGLSHDGVTWDKVRCMTLRLLDAIRRWGPLVTLHHPFMSRC